MKELERFTFGMGDRFAHQGQAQLQAVLQAKERGIQVYPVWNKSNREHTIVGSTPDDLRAEADAAVKALEWGASYYVDADHIGLKTVDRFLSASDFYTIDVADFTGHPAPADAIEAFVAGNKALIGSLAIPGIAGGIEITEATLRAAANKYLLAAMEAGAIYRYIVERKGADNFATEVSVDETDLPQTPEDLLLILAMLAKEGVPAQTIAPKFTGRFNKGVDYVGDIAQFEKEFDEDLCVIAYAVREFGLPKSLKLSVHSGSDKFSLYPIIRRLIAKHGTGLHVKTAGTTWLEEVIGLAEAGGDALELAKAIYAEAYSRPEELIKPYAPVVDINFKYLPSPEMVKSWSSTEFVSALRHEQSCPAYNVHFRQFIHVSFRIAAEFGNRYTDALKAHSEVIGRNVTYNLFNRHILPLFDGI